jgi:acyl-CoA synthetase (AMP-forming)/AMP-acid ligase II
MFKDPFPHIRREPPMGSAKQVPVTLGRTIADDADELIQSRGGDTAIIFQNRHYTFQQIITDARSLASAFARLGIARGEVISMQLPNWPEAMVINLAACYAGLIINPIVPIYRDGEVSFILRQSRSLLFFVPRRFRNFDYLEMAGRLRPHLPDLAHVVHVGAGLTPDDVMNYQELIERGARDPQDLAKVDPGSVKMVMYTSGTTGNPKGVLHNHETLAHATRACANYWKIGEGSLVMMPSPVTHVTGYMYALELPFLVGSRAALMERWDAEEAVDLVINAGVNATMGATPFLQELLEVVERRKVTLPSLRVHTCGGAAVPESLIYRARDLLPDTRTFRVYGSTEAPVVAIGCMEPEDIAIAASTDGKVLHYELKIIDDENRQVAKGGEGEILAAGPSLFLGYSDPVHNVDAFDQDGYFRTGDLGREVFGNALIITGRKKDLIIRGGQNLSAKEIEDVLHRHPAIREVAAVAMPHERLGETVCVYVIARPDTSIKLADIVAAVEQAGLAKQKYPERLEIVDDLPRTASGKIRKDLLRASIAQKIREEAA